jgi:hypothetical protein
MATPISGHWTVVKIIISYLKETMSVDLYFMPSASLLLSAFSSTDWVDNSDDRHNTRGYIIFLSNSSVSWSSQKQSTVSDPVRKSNRKLLLIPQLNLYRFKYFFMNSVSPRRPPLPCGLTILELQIYVPTQYFTSE